MNAPSKSSHVIAAESTAMRLYSYVVARDYGFAPNPFHGICTLATCKPVIRRCAQVGDWIVGTGSASHGLSGHLVFVMQVSEKMTYNQYWDDPRFQSKRPNLHGSLKQAFGDNIYHQVESTNLWHQEPSHHSLVDGSANSANIKNDTQTDLILVGEKFAYWGGNAPLLPVKFRRPVVGQNICANRGHKCNFPPQFVDSFLEWVDSREESGYLHKPKQFIL